MNENKNPTYLNLCDAAKTVLRGKLNVMNTYTKKEKKISNQSPNLYD